MGRHGCRDQGTSLGRSAGTERGRRVSILDNRFRKAAGPSRARWRGGELLVQQGEGSGTHKIHEYKVESFKSTESRKKVLGSIPLQALLKEFSCCPSVLVGFPGASHIP